MILSGWKEIAHYTGRGVRTVQRWEQFGLPVRRPAGHSRSAVTATSEAIDAWIRACGNAAGPIQDAVLENSAQSVATLRASLAAQRTLVDEQRALRDTVAAAREKFERSPAWVDLKQSWAA